MGHFGPVGAKPFAPGVQGVGQLPLVVQVRREGVEIDLAEIKQVWRGTTDISIARSSGSASMSRGTEQQPILVTPAVRSRS